VSPERLHRARKRGALGWPGGVATLGFLVVFGLLFARFFLVDRVEVEAEPIRVEIERGSSFEQVVDRLEEHGVIEGGWFLRVWGYLAGGERRIRSGRYVLEPGLSPRSLLGILVRGETEPVRVTVPEGRRADEVAAIFSREAGVDSTAFMEAVGDTTLAAELGLPGGGLEGFLFPDTYRIDWKAEAQNVVRAMVGRFHEVFERPMRIRAAEMGCTVREVVALASIIEAEAAVDAERERISAVYHNRMERGIRLEADPTVAYALGTRKERLLFEDLEVDSPYNTYRYKGLPPGPIANPGKRSLEAALNPDPECEDLYFVARGDGTHLFAATLADHVRNKNRVRGRDSR
jgi:UPF0755 protein